MLEFVDIARCGHYQYLERRSCKTTDPASFMKTTMLSIMYLVPQYRKRGLGFLHNKPRRRWENRLQFELGVTSDKYVAWKCSHTELKIGSLLQGNRHILFKGEVEANRVSVAGAVGFSISPMAASAQCCQSIMCTGMLRFVGTLDVLVGKESFLGLSHGFSSKHYL